MASDINPTLAPTKSLVNFRFWCQKVLPLVYDDSLSYYEVLGKMVVQLNDVIDNINADTENVLTLKDAFLELQSYVNEFFDDIDQLASYAERAEDAQTAANASAINAAASASNASASSLAAMDARDTAVAAGQAAQTSANTASTAATNATTKANEAAQSAITAQTAQASASQSATLAATDRSAAQTAASTATTKANEASESATNAEQNKTETEELVNNIQENLDNIQQNTEDITDLKNAIDKLSISRYLMKLTRSYADASLTVGNRTFYINDNMVSCTGSASNTTYYQINLTGSVLRARSGSRYNFTVYDEDFVPTSIFKNIATDSPATFILKKYITEIPATASEAGYFYIFGRTADGTVVRTVHASLFTTNSVIDLTALLNDYEEMAIYYTRGVSNSNRNSSLIYEFDFIRAPQSITSALALALENN